MAEKQLISQVLVRLKKINKSWWYKIPDPTRCPKCGTVALTNKKPFDIIGSAFGIGWAIEVKVGGRYDVTPHQRGNLQLFAMSRGVAIILRGDKVFQVLPSGREVPRSEDLYSIIESSVDHV